MWATTGNSLEKQHNILKAPKTRLCVAYPGVSNAQCGGEMPGKAATLVFHCFPDAEEASGCQSELSFLKDQERGRTTAFGTGYVAGVSSTFRVCQCHTGRLPAPQGVLSSREIWTLPQNSGQKCLFSAGVVAATQHLEFLSPRTGAQEEPMSLQ